ncbi:MAG: Calcium-transporting ATPase CtpE [Eubacteriales bacterium SKADARSKE-1]|nr:Calcium-transporting ATPase CtpE [Eubacteriales bacterium SKADARSKE-1]
MANVCNNIKRYMPDPKVGLSLNQVQSRICDNLVNTDSSIPTKTIPTIIKNHLFTLFNLINFILAAAIIYVGSYKNLLFMGVVVSNLIIGVYQEIRAKRTVDKLSIVSSTKIIAKRAGKEVPIGINDIVLDDIILLKSGDQVPSDCKVMSGECEANESLLTGESDAVCKKNGDMLLSGSFLVSGYCGAKVEHIGDDNYAFTISKDAKYLKKVNSEILKTFQRIILILSILIIPIGTLLFMKQFDNNRTFEDAVINTTAAIIGMIPEGLVLLTSTVLAVSVVRLARQKVLVQELHCIETLARVDTLCLDKTGTLTEGIMEVSKIVPMNQFNKEDMQGAISALSGVLSDDNPTISALKQGFLKKAKKEKLVAQTTVPFSSEKKWSGAYFENQGSYLLGAAEFILKDNINEIEEDLNKYNRENRVVVLAHSKNNFKDCNLPDNIEVMGFILLKDKIRKEAKETLKYFKEQDVDIKVISGDNVLTVSNVAKRAGLESFDSYIDFSKIKTVEELKQAANKYSIFGRVTPAQKKELICALKENGHTVAMTGDGVNDVLALKEADCSVAMASGSSAAKNVSQLVLLDSNFDAMPKVVAEGRRSINNIQRSSSLFLVKTIYSTLLALVFLFLHMSYPFRPVQMTLTSVFTIGIPAFILALGPNKERIHGNLFANIISRAMPCALTIVTSILLIMAATNFFNSNHSQISTLCVISAGFSEFLLLFKICQPFNILKKILFALMCLGFIIGITHFKSFFSLSDPSFHMALAAAAVILLDVILFYGQLNVSRRVIRFMRNLKAKRM